MFVCLCVSADVCATGVAVMRVEGLKVNSPCSSSRRSSPAALKMCSRGVPGNSLKDTKSGKLLIPCTHTLSHCPGFVCLTLSHTHCHISLSMIEGISIMLFWRESWGNLSLTHTHTHTHTHTLTGQLSSVGVPKASKILVSWSRSESPARNGKIGRAHV